MLLFTGMAASLMGMGQQKEIRETKKPDDMHHPQITYLALGDSYTIGEAVAAPESFPYQTVRLLRENRVSIADPEIVAATGWTTDELSAAIKKRKLLPHYNVVTLLIGVNNQYRGRSIENYKTEFKSLLEQAIVFAANKRSQVVVLTIPDYGITPFAKNRNPDKISRELNAFNAAAKEMCAAAGVGFLDINTTFRNAATDLELVATDGLHPSGKSYRQWAEQLSAVLQQILK